jgi:lipopolysaccharide export system permease protein
LTHAERTTRRRAPRVTILDRYMLAELAGPFGFGLSAFTLIFVATQVIAIGKLVSDEHAPLNAAIQYFLLEMPQYELYVIPMSVLLGVLLMLQRLSVGSELVAMQAGGVGLARITAPVLLAALLLSLLVFVAQETVVPAANVAAVYVREAVIKHLNPLGSNLTITTGLANGGRQLTHVDSIDPTTQQLLGVTVVQFDAHGEPRLMIFGRRANFDDPEYTFLDARTYHFEEDGVQTSVDPRLTVDIGGRPSDLSKNAILTNPEEMSRAQIAASLGSGNLSDPQIRTFRATYDAKLARPFASFVFALIAIPFGLRPARGSGTGLGFGLAVAIVFIYYVVTTVFLALGGLSGFLSGICAWAPNLLFTAFGLTMLRRASAS